MNVFKTDFEKRWVELSQDVEKLNEYTTTHPTELRGVKVEGKNLDAAIFIESTFDGVEWTNVSLEKANFTKTIFRNCKFVNTQNWNSTFTNVLFENCTFYGAEFSGSTMKDVRFKGCKITDSRLKELAGNQLVIEGSVLEKRTSLAWSSIPMTFLKCTLDGVGLSGMKQPHSMLIEDCLLDEVDFSRSHFSTVTLRRVRQGEGGVYFNEVTAESISFEDVEMLEGTGIGDATVGMVRIVGGKIYGPTFKGANIATTYIRDAYVTRFALGNMGQVHVTSSTMHRSGFFQGGIDEMSVSNSTLDEIVGENFKADIVMWDNVILDGKIDLTNAQVNDFRPTRLKRGPKLQLITTGSNMRF